MRRYSDRLEEDMLGLNLRVFKTSNPTLVKEWQAINK
jgi:hypothetical protein